MSEQRIGVYAGTFDPITLGHWDMIERSRQCCDLLYVAVYAGSKGKSRGMWSAMQRLDAVTLACESLHGVVVKPFDGLLVDFAKDHAVSMIFRGIRDPKDGVYEGQMAAMNAHMYPRAETLLLTASPHLAHLSATWVREIHAHGGDVRSWVPQAIHPLLAGA